MKSPLIFGFGFLLGAACLALSHSLESNQASIPSYFPLIHKQDFSVVYDARFKVPYFTYERLTRESLQGTADRESLLFKEEPQLNTLHRSSLKDYEGSKYDRGHMTPAADLKQSESALKESFALSNICPQDPQLNRGLWRKIEKYARELTNTYDVVEVITGPLFLASDGPDGRMIQIKVIGPSDVAVPTHFFKVIHAQGRDTPDLTRAFVAPNQPIDKSTPLEQLEVSVQEIERKSGILLNTSKR